MSRKFCEPSNRCCEKNYKNSSNSKNGREGGEGGGGGGGGGGIRFASLLCKHLGLSRRQAERMMLTERVTLFGRVVASPNFEIHPSDDDPHQDGSKAVKVDGKLIVGVDATLKNMHAELQLLRRQQQQQQQEQQRQQHGELNDGSDSGKNMTNGKRKESGHTTSIQKNQHEVYSNTRIWLANKLKGELVTEVRELDLYIYIRAWNSACMDYYLCEYRWLASRRTRRKCNRTVPHPLFYHIIVG